jgi:hypothetical protein
VDLIELRSTVPAAAPAEICTACLVGQALLFHTSGWKGAVCGGRDWRYVVWLGQGAAG